MNDEIAEIEKRLCICGPEYTDRGLTSPYCKVHEFAADILFLFKNIQVEIECPECEGIGEWTKQNPFLVRDKTYLKVEICNICKGKKTITRPATPEELEKGGILREAKE